MTAISEFVRTTAYEITSTQFRLPGFMWSALSSFNQVHAAWRWYRKGILYSNPDNFSQLLTGHVVNFVCGESTLLKIAAQSLLVATRLLECARQQASIYNEGKRLIAAIKGHYPYPLDIAWSNASCPFVLSPSSLYTWKVICLSAWHRVTRVAIIASKIFFKMFILSMCIMDTIDAFYISPTTKNEAINECCLNIIQWLDTLVDSKEVLLQGLTENREVIEKILKGSPVTYIQLQSSVASALNVTETLQQQVKKVTTFGNGLLINVGKQSLHGALVVTGINKIW